jgi:hypothetical protein
MPKIAFKGGEDGPQVVHSIHSTQYKRTFRRAEQPFDLDPDHGELELKLYKFHDYLEIVPDVAPAPVPPKLTDATTDTGTPAPPATPEPPVTPEVVPNQTPVPAINEAPKKRNG